jgi:hypothetical protein
MTTENRIMTLTSKQQGVLRGILSGAAITIVVLAAAIITSPISFSSTVSFGQRITFALKADLLLALWLLISIGWLARHRFITPEDIDGGGLTQGTEQARILQSTLQNTIEQTVFAVLVHMIWAVTMPLSWLATIPAAAILFLSGRILFVRGYIRGAPFRAVGFALTFYPSVLMLLIATVAVVLDLIV